MGKDQLHTFSINPKPETLNPKPGIRSAGERLGPNPKPNPKPTTLNQLLLRMCDLVGADEEDRV
jgi:hypothetical protein